MAHVTKHPELEEEEQVRVICSPSEFEYLMMGLHAFVPHNLTNVDKFKDERLEHEDAVVEIGEMFIEQHVEVSRLIDQLAESYGYDPAVEG